jgi:hypothetical protein
MMMFQEDVNKANTQAAAEVNPLLISAQIDVAKLTQSLRELDLTEFGRRLGEITTDIFNPIEILKRTQFLDEEATKIRNSLGLGSEKSRELSLMIGDNISRFAALGLKVDDVGKAFVDIASVYGANIAISNEEFAELAATAKVTGSNVKTLSAAFRGVGVSIGQVGDKMVEVTEIARNAGVSVSAVSDGVLKNLDKMNIYNFEGGTKGLAKMSAQATRLGIDMTKIFDVVEKVFNPEGAIELASHMQRLGVQTNALLDPLRLMDLSQNDPTELSNQIVNMSKDFVRFNKELGQFEILPGEKRRLNEIGKALGMNNGELQKMALNAANLDMKMKQIKFPSSIASKDDRELIATLATVNKAGIAEVKVKQIDAETGKWTGEYDKVDVSRLTAEQLQGLKEGQELQGKSMEEIAVDQLSEATKLNALVEQTLQAVRFGFSTSEPSLNMFKTTTKTIREAAFQEKGREGGAISEGARRTTTYRKGTNKAAETIEGIFNEKLKDFGFSSIDDLKDKSIKLLTDSFSNLTGSFKGIDLGILDGFGNIVDKIGSVAESFGIGGSETDPGSKFVNNQTNTSIARTNVQNLNTIATPNTIEVKPIDINEKLDVNITVNLDPSIKDQRLTDIATEAVNKWFTGGDSAAHIKTITDALAEKISQNSMVVANVEKRGFVQTPGMG